MDKLNEKAVSYRAILGEAFRQGIDLAKKGIQFDFVVDGAPARKAGYDRIITIHTDGTVE